MTKTCKITYKSENCFLLFRGCVPPGAGKYIKLFPTEVGISPASAGVTLLPLPLLMLRLMHYYSFLVWWYLPRISLEREATGKVTGKSKVETWASLF